MQIRSQDKMKLVEKKDVEIEEVKYYTKIHGVIYRSRIEQENEKTEWQITNNGNLIGTYSTVDKAVRVVDMMVHFIKTNGMGFRNDHNITVVGSVLNVFEMPRDDEV